MCKSTILEKYEDMFKTEVDTTKACTITEHMIITEDCQPICLSNNQIPKYWEDEIDREIKSLLERGIIRR